VLIIPSSWGSQLNGDLHHQHHAASRLFLAPLPGTEEEEVPTSTTRQQQDFSGAVAGEKEDFCKGSFARTSFTLF
jgi:hypothetical protein